MNFQDLVRFKNNFEEINREISRNMLRECVIKNNYNHNLLLLIIKLKN